MTGGECGGNYAAHWRTEPLKNEHYFGFGITAWYLLPCLEEGLPRSRARCSPCSQNTSVMMPKAASPVPAAQSQTSQEPTALGLVEINTRVTHPRVFFPQMLGQHHPGAVLAWLFPLSCSARPCFRHLSWSWLCRTTPVPPGLQRWSTALGVFCFFVPQFCEFLCGAAGAGAASNPCHGCRREGTDLTRRG